MSKSPHLPELKSIKDHPAYAAFKSVKSRCNNPNNKDFAHYGGRGIRVCAEWNEDSRAFCAWADAHGHAPGLELDRKCVDGPYSPENCHFITKSENARNRRDSGWWHAEGERYETAKQAAEALGMNATTLISRVQSPAYGKYFRTPRQPNYKRKPNLRKWIWSFGSREFETIQSLAAALKISRNTAAYRVKSDSFPHYKKRQVRF